MSTRIFTLFLLIVLVGSAGCSVEDDEVSASSAVVSRTTTTQSGVPTTIRTPPVSFVSSTVATTTTQSGNPTTTRTPPASVVSTTAVTTTDVATTTTAVEKPLSPAWIEAKQLYIMFDVDATDDEYSNYLSKDKDYWSNNPNSLSSPVGALCWAFHEITGSENLTLERYSLDAETRFMADLIGLIIENNGRNPADVLFEFLDLDLDTIAETRSVEGLSLESAQALALYRTPWINWMRQRNEVAGDGTEWMTALHAVSAPEIEDATKAGDGLPAGAQQFSDAFFDAVAEYLESGKTYPEDFHESEFWDHSGLPGYDNFIDVVKYAPDCQRMYGLSWQDTLFYDSAPEVEPPAFEIEPGNTTTTLAYGGLEPSPAWIEQQKWSDITQFDGSDEHLNYLLINPNKLSTPMGALCWAHLETEQAITRYFVRGTIDNEMILPYIEALGLTTEQIGTGAQATEVLRQLLGSQDSSDKSGLESVKISEEHLTIPQEKLALLKDDWQSTIEPLDKVGGNGSEWLDMLREVAQPEVEAVTRTREGLYAPAREFSDALFGAVGEYLNGTRGDLLDESGLSSELPNWNGFVQIASLSPDCQRAWLYRQSRIIFEWAGR